MAWRVTLYLQKYWEPNSGGRGSEMANKFDFLFLLSSSLRLLVACFRRWVESHKVSLSMTGFLWATTFATVWGASSGVCLRRWQFGFWAAAGRADLLSAASGGSLLAAVIRNTKSTVMSELFFQDSRRRHKLSFIFTSVAESSGYPVLVLREISWHAKLIKWAKCAKAKLKIRKKLNIYSYKIIPI